jgi:DNA-binding transcriptional ArsR family regulator
MINAEQIEISFEHGGAYDLLASLHVLYNPEFYGVRAAWAAGMRQRMPKETRDTLEQMIVAHQVSPYWIASLDGPKDCQTVLTKLRALSPLERLELLDHSLPAQIAVLRRVAAQGQWGEQDLHELQAIENTIASKHGGHHTVKDYTQILHFWAEAEATSKAYLSALEVYYELFFATEEQRISASLERAEDYARQVVDTLDLSRALETLSRGVNLDAFLDQPKLLLVPSFWSTPIVLLGHKLPDTRLIIFGARTINEPLVPGEIAPDSLVNVLKALADPTRLAILKFVHQEPLLPSQLAARLRLRPATVSHHLKILRLAGLVFIRVGAGKETIYSARIEELQDSLAALEGFLKADEEH